MVSGVIIYNVTNPFGTAFSNSMLGFPLYFAGALTLFWIVGAMNTINFIDGLDGLAAGITAIAAIVLFIHSFRLTQYTISLLPLALTGAALGFLPHNFFPAKITMGTSGAVFLGYGLACLSIVGGTKAATVLLVLGVPILDAAWIIFRRILRGQSPFRGDQAHLHHRLAQMGLSQSQIVLLLYSLCAMFGVLALVLSTRLLKLYAIGGMVILVGGIFALMAQKRFDKVG
jgi:UDP-N-acetylmuramyl pentapeptide phosphotransferase/UDP-N-acetylglucosamine-1-phosphate transferase